MSVKSALENFMQRHEEMLKSLEDLKNISKEEGSKYIQNYIKLEEFNNATKMVRDLDNFTKVSFSSNAEEIIESVRVLFDGKEKIANGARNANFHHAGAKYGKANEESYSDSYFGKSYSEDPLSLEQPIRDTLSEEEKELLKTLGYTGASRFKDSKRKIDESLLRNLSKKGFVAVTEIPWGKQDLVTFELTAPGKRKFEELYGIEPNESLQKELSRKYSSIQKGFFVYDLETALQIRGFTLEKISENEIELSKDKIYYYLTPDIGEFSERDYLTILDRKNQLKSIGFICVDAVTLKKAKQSVEKWIDENPAKCKFLSIHLTTLDHIENAPQIFESYTF